MLRSINVPAPVPHIPYPSTAPKFRQKTLKPNFHDSGYARLRFSHVFATCPDGLIYIQTQTLRLASVVARSQSTVTKKAHAGTMALSEFTTLSAEWFSSKFCTRSTVVVTCRTCVALLHPRGLLNSSASLSLVQYAF